MTSPRNCTLEKSVFLGGVFLISFSMLVFQIVQTRILSVIAWYYLAFFAISVAMLGMTVGAVRVYLRRDLFRDDQLALTLSDHSLACAISMPLSLLVQFSLILTMTLSLTTLASWSLLLAAMAVPYVFAGIVLSLALTRSPFPVGQIYAVDLLGAALACLAVVFILNRLDGPSAILLAASIAGLASVAFSRARDTPGRPTLHTRRRLLSPVTVTIALLLLTALNATSRVGFRPILVKDRFDGTLRGGFERWNSYSRIAAGKPEWGRPWLWGASPQMPPDLRVPQVFLNIDGLAGTFMYHYDGAREPLEFLRYDLVNLAYNLPGIRKVAVIGVGGGRDLLSAHLYGAAEIVGVELNPIFIDLHTHDPLYSTFSNLRMLPNLELFVDDARSWFASTSQKFDLVQMSMIDTWAATGAGAFSLSENGLYTLEGWKTFMRTLNEDGVLTVSRWYNPGDVNEAGRMIALAIAAVLDAGAPDARPHLFVATAGHIATLVLSRQPFTATQLATLSDEVRRLGFKILLAPDHPPESALLATMVASKDLPSLNRAAGSVNLDLTVPTDDRPFFFNQLRFSSIPKILASKLMGEPGRGRGGVVAGNLIATGALVVILVISILAVVFTIVLPMRGLTRDRPLQLIAVGSAYFLLIGIGFMLAEIALLQSFSLYLGHPIYSLSVCLFGLILATGLGSGASERLGIASPCLIALWALVVFGYLLGLPDALRKVFEVTAGRPLSVRIFISLAMIMPLGFLLGFAFPTGIKMVEAIDREPTPWFWGINGAAGVLASSLAVVLSMAFGISVTFVVAAVCYLGLVLPGIMLSRLGSRQLAAAE